MKRFIRVYGSGSGSVRHPGYNGYLPPVIITSDVIGQFYVEIFFGLELL